MAGPNPKRAKMDNPNEESSKNRKIPELINPKTQSFAVIRNMLGFVDHTNFIREFLLESSVAIFAPPRFGKSSHLDMLNQFLQIDMDETTRNGPAKGRQNYKLFEGTRIITDNKNKKLVENHLGKHPVIHLDFKGAVVRSVKEAKMHCRKVVHKAYLDHSYLTTSTKLSDYNNTSAQRVCKMWCNDKQFETLPLESSLTLLTTCLFNHFNRAPVYILVDEVDAMNSSALHKLRESDKNSKINKLNTIRSILENLLGSVTKGCSEVVGVLFTGVSYVPDQGYSSQLNNITKIKFLDTFTSDPNFVPFYGARREEVENLIQKLVKTKNLVNFEGKKEFLNDTNELDAKKIMDDVQSRYNGYFNVDGIQIFCLSSVLSYLESGVAKNYWSETDGIENLYMILKSEDVAVEIIKLMKGKTIPYGSDSNILLESLVKLDDLLTKEDHNKASCRDVFNFLMEQGFLTYSKHYFKVPNAEVREVLNNMIKNIVNSHWNINTKKCTSLINDMSLSLINDEKALQKKILDLYKELCLIFSPLDEKKCALTNETRMLCTMYAVLYEAGSFVNAVGLPIQEAKDRPDFLTLHENHKGSILWELKYSKSSNDKFTTSLYALQEARDIVSTEKGKTKRYMGLLKNLGRETLVIGLSLDSNLKVSLSYALGMEEKIFFISDWESSSFPILYQSFNAVPLPLNSC